MGEYEISIRRNIANTHRRIPEAGASGTSLAMQWLASGVPLTLLMGIAAVYSLYSFEIAHEEAFARRCGGEALRAVATSR